MSLYNINNLSLMVDIGNSTIVFGFFRDGKLFYSHSVPTEKESLKKIDFTLNEIVKKLDLYIKDFKGGLIASVAPSYTNSIKEAIKRVLQFDIQVMDASYHHNLKTIADNPSEIGQDLIADVYGCLAHYGTKSIVFDLGTITKVIPIDKDGLFLGVSFLPGIATSIKSMNDNTELLCASKLSNKPDVEYGNNTIDAMSTGIYYATLGAIKEFSLRAEKNYGPYVKKILTGGYAYLFADDLDGYILDKDLVLKGIYQLYIKN